MQTEIKRLITEINNNLKEHPKLPSSIEKFITQPELYDTNLGRAQETLVLDLLKQYLDAIVKRYNIITKERHDLCRVVDDAKQQINGEIPRLRQLSF